MISQPDLFSTEHVYVPRHAPETSAQAAAAVKPKTPSQRQRVLAAIRELGGATDFELSEYLHLDLNSIRPRRVSLREDGLIVDSSLRRKNANGNDSVIWRCT